MIYVNISNTFRTRGRTGIQRVVRQLVSNLSDRKDIEFLAFNDTKFYVLDKKTEVPHILKAAEFTPKRPFDFDEIRPNDILFDVDATWGDFYDLEQLLIAVRKKGAKVARLHYDAVPVQFPELAQTDTLIRFRETFFYHAKYVDYWLAISQVVWNDLNNIFEQFKFGRPVGTVIPLGADIAINEADAKVRDLSEVLSKPYFISVGTIEPRKNYEFLIDTYLNYLKVSGSNGYFLVIVGKKGWASDKVTAQLKKLEAEGKLIWFTDLNDRELSILYKNAKASLQFSHYEGYGLPVVEALAYGVPVFCTKNTAMEEVGKGYVHATELDPVKTAKTLHDFTKNSSKFSAKPSKFKIPSWKKSGDEIYGYLTSTMVEPSLKIPLHQAVYISIRPARCGDSIRYALKNASFIKNVVVMTNSKHEKEFLALAESLPVEFTVINEDKLFGDSIPEDHQIRNTFLRRKLYGLDIIKDNFLAIDDDYVISKPAKRNDFVLNGKHYGHYYMCKGEEWMGAGSKPSSFDQGMFRTARYLSERQFDTKLYGAHQPQIINKKIALDILNRTSGLGLDEWSTYFNIAKFLYPDYFTDRKFRSVGWPENYSSWLPTVSPEKPIFLNRPDHLSLTKFNFDSYAKSKLEDFAWRDKARKLEGYPQATLFTDPNNFGFLKPEIKLTGKIRLDIALKSDKVVDGILRLYIGEKKLSFDLGQYKGKFILLPVSKSYRPKRIKAELAALGTIRTSELTIKYIKD